MNSTFTERDAASIIRRMSRVDFKLPSRYWVSAKRAYQQDCRVIRAMGIIE